MILQADVEWCSKLFALIQEGGIWGIPRSGLIFHKEGNRLVLDEMMPHDPDMTISPEAFREYQESEFEIVREHFGATGIEVVRKEGI